ncbi:hypothetical protein [Pantoea sp. GbtcB22]|uniref:hypothetical protein n=1 Tax=Pantoea sp. GbtcB22 TaxID=2824767 RepID=UPI001C30C229|nr:hypothetical protein [Pantoea sp. GbtcB22]
MKTTIPFWSIDAFLYWVMPRSYISEWSSELMSRVSGFLDAYIMFDKVVIPERYKDEFVLKKLDPDQSIFEYVESSSLLNSDELTKGLTIDLSLNFPDMDSLKNDDYLWFSQHSGYYDPEEYNQMASEGFLSFSWLRLWQLSLINEISDLKKCCAILPLSLRDIDGYQPKTLPFHMNKVNELNTHYQSLIKSVSVALGEEFNDYLENVPPFLSLVIDQSLSQEHSIDVVAQLREDYKELRASGSLYSAEIIRCKGLREKKDVIDDWNDAWSKLLNSSFREPSLFKRKVSLGDFSKAVVAPQTAGLSTVIQHLLEHAETYTSYKRFRIYCDLYTELDSISFSQKKLEKTFSVNLMNNLKL